MKIDKDKQLHIIYSICITIGFVIGYYILVKELNTSLFLAGSTTFIVGVMKEFYDYLNPDRHTAEWGDLLADIIGIFIGLILSVILFSILFIG